MKAIETEYNGYKFRSRSEARWAVFFETLGIKYIYEPEGYVFEDGTRYLPDFYLPNAKMFFEVKGIGLSKEDKTKINNLIAYSGRNVAIGYSDLSFQATDIYGENNQDIALGLKENSWLIRCNACNEYQFIGSLGAWTCRGCGYYDGDSGYSWHCNGNWVDSPHHCDQPYGEEVIDAFRKAKQARFEHGEKW